jgi:uncharacterized heparinase superfamily protein
LDVINLFKKNRILINQKLGNQDQFLIYVINKAENMCGWLSFMMYSDGTIPHFNDSTDGVALEPNKLLFYAKDLGLNFSFDSLDGSGYRRLNNEIFDAIVKAGKIGPDYIPGHAHADSLSFECRIGNQPFIVDIGISTYEKNPRRQKERSTLMHNTVIIDDKNSSTVWGGFRVGQRASTFITYENKTNLSAYHNGYKVTHKRNFNLSNTVFSINDEIQCKTALIIYHFHPDIVFEKVENTLKTNKAVISFDGAKGVVLSEYEYCLGFNKVICAQKVTISFENSITTKISF